MKINDVTSNNIKYYINQIDILLVKYIDFPIFAAVMVAGMILHAGIKREFGVKPKLFPQL